MIKKDKLTASQWATLLKSGGVTNEKKDSWYPSEKSLKGNITPNAGRILNGVHPSQAELESYKDFLRPNMISLSRCNNVLIEGVTFQNSPAWTMHPLLCNHVTIRNVNVKNHWYAQNSDAVDLESCRNGILEGCTFDTGDDGITIKSGRDEQGRKRGVPTENFIIRDCKVYHAHGGFVIGSEMSGGVRNLFVSNCTFMGSDVGLRFKTARGRGGVVENIFMRNVEIGRVSEAILTIDFLYETGANGPHKPVVRNVQIENVTSASSPRVMWIAGFAGATADDIRFIDCTFRGVETSEQLAHAGSISFRNVTIEPAKSR